MKKETVGILVAKHKELLLKAGLLEEFLSYVREAAGRNPCLRRYLDWS